MLMLTDIVAASREVAATRSRLKKIARFAELLRQLEASELPAAVGFLCGELRQGRLGLGPRTLQQVRSAPEPERPRVTVLELDAVFQALEELSGKGVASEREQLLSALFARLSAEERDFVVRLILGELRQGALESIVLDALAQAAHVSRRFHPQGDALCRQRRGRCRECVSRRRGRAVGVHHPALRPLRPMLAQSAKDAAEAFARTAPAAVEYKLDGARIQLHREGERVAIYSRYAQRFD